MEENVTTIARNSEVPLSVRKIYNSKEAKRVCLFVLVKKVILAGTTSGQGGEGGRGRVAQNQMYSAQAQRDRR